MFAIYTLRFSRPALEGGRMFHEESEEVKKYVGGLPDMIWGNVMSFEEDIKSMFCVLELELDIPLTSGSYTLRIPLVGSRFNRSNSLSLFKGLELVRYGVSNVLDMAYWGFLRVGTTFDIFQNILFPYSLNTAYCLLLDTAYWILFPLWSLVSVGTDTLTIQLFTMKQVIIIAQPQHQADVHQDELCPPNRRYALMDVNKKVDLENPLCPDESRILVNMDSNNTLKFLLDGKVDTQTLVSLCLLSTWPKGLRLLDFVFLYDGIYTAFSPPTNSTAAGLIYVLQNTLQVSLAEQKSHDVDEARENVEQVKEHLLAEEIEKLVEGSENVAENVAEYVDENVEVSSSPPRNDDIQNVLGTKLEPKSDKESSKVEITVVVTSVNDIDEEEDMELTKTDPTPSSSIPSSSSPSHNLSVRNRLLSLFKAKPGQFRHYKSFFQELKGLILEREKSQVDVEKMIADAIQIERENLRSEISSQLNDAIANQIPSQLQQTNLPIWLALKYKFERMSMSSTTCRPSVVRPRDEDDPHDGAHPEGENSAKRKEILVPPVQPKPTPKGKSRPEKIALSLHKFPVVNFPDDDIEERTFRWVDKCVKRFYPYACYRIIKTYGELGHEHKFVTEIVARRANGRIVNTVIWERVHDFQLGVESYQQQVNLTAPTITFPGIEKYKVLSIIFEPIYGIIYKNTQEERGVIRHQEVHNLSKEDVEYLQLFYEEIEERLKCRDQMRIWEMYVNERPLGPRREHPE
ncbi:hypothetical protein Tco_1523885 [Tanacetum coccineum]